MVAALLGESVQVPIGRVKVGMLKSFAEENRFSPQQLHLSPPLAKRDRSVHPLRPHHAQALAGGEGEDL
jgi:hypothetical protein